MILINLIFCDSWLGLCTDFPEGINSAMWSEGSWAKQYFQLQEENTKPLNENFSKVDLSLHSLTYDFGDCEEHHLVIINSVNIMKRWLFKVDLKAHFKFIYQRDWGAPKETVSLLWFSNVRYLPSNTPKNAQCISRLTLTNSMNTMR